MYRPKTKTIVIMLIYMILVYTLVNVFVIGAYSYEEFTLGGSHQELFEKKELGWQEQVVEIINTENLTGSDMFDWCNETFGTYLGKFWHFYLPLDSGWYHVWSNNNNEETVISEWKFEKMLLGTLTYNDISWQEQFGNLLGNIWNGLGYVMGLLSFDLAGTHFSDNIEIPPVLSAICVLAVIIPWIFITIWLLPLFIQILKAIAEAIPL